MVLAHSSMSSKSASVAAALGALRPQTPDIRPRANTAANMGVIALEVYALEDVGGVVQPDGPLRVFREKASQRESDLNASTRRGKDDRRGRGLPVRPAECHSVAAK